MELPLVFFFSCITLSYSYDVEPHKNEAAVERFRFGDYDFVFYGREANWVEAYTICKATHSRLAVVNTIELANFLAESLTQTKVVFEDVWIGGRFINDRWRWAATGIKLSKRTKDFPPWLSYPTQRGKNCLALDRRNHREAIFVEKKCSIYRGFICEEDVTQVLSNEPEAGYQVQINNSQYFLYHARVTWEEAVTFCKQTEARLAVVPDVGTAKALVYLMKRTRPVFENVWIGARRYYYDWTWVSTEALLASETGSSGYPPWKANRPTDNSKNCVILDHHPCEALHVDNSRQHLCEEPIFIEEDCNFKKDFICEIVRTEEVNPLHYQVTVDRTTYLFFNERKTWVGSLLVCENLLMTLATPETDRQWDFIITYMNDMQDEFDHVWLGGRWIPNEWVWLNNHSIPILNNKQYPPWCSDHNFHEQDEDCLNLDRDSHNIAVIYGYNCSIKQKFVCQVESTDAIETPAMSPQFNQLRYIPIGATHVEAELACAKNRSYLAVVNDMKLAQKMALMLPRDTLVWIGGKREANIWRWMRTKEVIPDLLSDDNYPPWESSTSLIGDKVCLAMKSGYREQPLFVEQHCMTKLNYVCQPEIQELPPPDEIADYDGIKHYFYRKGVTWNEAIRTCSSGKLYLVNVGNLGLAKFILNVVGGKSSQWTAGKETLLGNWSWVTTGQILPNEIRRGYPPWFKNTIPSNKEQQCLLLKKLDNKPTFLPENCSAENSFVCVDKIFITNDTDITVGNVTISIEDIITSIAEAKQKCIESGKSVIDFSKVNSNRLKNILKREGVKSIWLDVVYNSNGKWVYTDTLQEFKTDLDFPERNKHFKNDPRKCLTLQKSSEGKLILIPSLCSDFSRIVCMTNQTENPAPPEVDKSINDSVTIIFKLEEMRLSDATLYCTDKGGEIINRALLRKTIGFFKDLHPSYEGFWIGATLVNGTWKWNYNTPLTLRKMHRVPEIRLPEAKEVHEGSCLMYSRSSGEIEATDCSEKYSTVCERVVLKCEPRKTVPNIEWSPSKCTQEKLDIGTTCRAKCPNPFNLAGSELYVCVKGIWSTNENPACRSYKDQGNALEKLFKKNAKSTMQSCFLFIIDNGLFPKKSFENLYYMKALHFTKHLANTMLLSGSRRAGIATYSRNAKIVDSMESHNCYLIKTIDKLLSRRELQLSNTRPNYFNAFEAAETFLNKTVNNGSGLIFFFAMRPDTGPIQKRTEIIKRLKANNVTIAVVNVGEEIKRSLLEEIASTRLNELLLYSFGTLKGLDSAGNDLRKRAKFRSTDCAKNL